MIRYIYQLLHPRFQKLFLEYPVTMQPRYGHGKPPHKGLYTIIDRHRASYAALLAKVVHYLPDFKSVKHSQDQKDPAEPAWKNGFLPGLDIITLFMMIAEYKPGRYIEIGSGNSTKVVWKAKNIYSPDTKIISIDPMPRAEIDSLADEIIRKPFEMLGQNEFPSMEAGDILFVDNSHRILPNSDAMVFFMELLPDIPEGVIIQVHDVYLPYDYPPFMCERFYSEQYGLAMYLMANPHKYVPVLPNYFISEDPELSAIANPVWQLPGMQDVEHHGGSFWFLVKN
jgi:hypothetical protein